MSADSPDDEDLAAADGSDLDSTLLGSLFYNEIMMMLDDDSTEVLSSLTGVANGVEAETTYAPAPASPPGKQAAKRETSAGTSSVGTATKEGPSHDPLTVAEQSLLRDFGVAGSSPSLPHISNDPSDEKDKPQVPASQVYTQSQSQSQSSKQDPQTSHTQSWANGQQTHHYQHQNQDPNRLPPHQQYQNHHQHPSQSYHPHSHHPTPHQGSRQQHQQPYIQPRSPEPQVSKGIKHSVKPVTTKPQGENLQSVVTQQASIPNPLSHSYPSHTPVHPSAHPRQPQHPPPHYPPPASHIHPSHHPPPPPSHQHHHPLPHHQSYYHHPHAPPPGTVPTPALVPVPAPGSAHHHSSAYGPPPATAGHVSPPYNSSPPGNQTLLPVGGHPPAPPLPAHGHAHVRSSHHSHSIHHYPPVNPPKEQLVSQFATLANRLGINLPSDLLSSLTESAGKASSGGEVANGQASKYSSSLGVPPPPLSQTSSSRESIPSKNGASQESFAANNPTTVVSSNNAVNAKTSVAEAIRITAEEAIAAVTRKRSSDEAGFGKRTSNNSQSAGSGSESKAAYAKRRKKPRMADCEGRLAQLRAENEKLKRHLDNVTNQTHKFEQDRVKAEETMKQMLDSKDVPEEELNTVIREYTEAYSDYGRRRHEELSFHLEQLQKLANPTNFTKMGLWTIAKANGSKDMSKQNPLVGILQKELNIAPPQVKRILEQRQRIRLLVNNLNASLLLLQKLKDLCEQKNRTFNDRMTKTREILNPKQVVKLIMWIKEHSNVLGNICPGWTSEQIVKRHKASALYSPNTVPSASARPTNSDITSETSPESESK